MKQDRDREGQQQGRKRVVIPCRHPPEAGWKAALESAESAVAWKAAMGAAKVGRWLASIPQPAPPRSAYVSLVPPVKLLEKLLLLRSVPASERLQWDHRRTGDCSARTSAHGVSARGQCNSEKLHTISSQPMAVLIGDTQTGAGVLLADLRC